MTGSQEHDYYDKTPAAARRYDALLAGQTDDVAFYVDEARAADGPILEVGCGTGRIAQPIAAAGIDVVGLDRSPHMLAIAAAKRARAPADVRRRLGLVRADMRAYAFRRPFARVFLPFRVFQAMISVDDQMAALARTRAALAPDGRLVFNVFDPRIDILAEAADGGPSEVQDSGRSYEDGGDVVRERFAARYDLPRQVLDLTFLYERLGPGGRVVERVFEPLRLRYFFRFEIEHLLARAGYEVEAVFGGFEREPFAEHGQEMVWIARPVEA